jgi:hypothetical protein
MNSEFSELKPQQLQKAKPPRLEDSPSPYKFKEK